MERELTAFEQFSTAYTQTVGATEIEVSPTRLGRSRRVQFILTNLSAVTVTLTKGDSAAVANKGIILAQNQTYIESDDGGYNCWQGAFRVVASGAGTVSIVESFVV